jgi:hypothetical protein
VEQTELHRLADDVEVAAGLAALAGLLVVSRTARLIAAAVFLFWEIIGLSTATDLGSLAFAVCMGFLPAVMLVPWARKGCNQHRLHNAEYSRLRPAASLTSSSSLRG